MLRKLSQFFSRQVIPTQSVTIQQLQGVPAALAHDMSADRLHAILRATEGGQSDDYLALLRDIAAGDSNVLTDFGQRKTRLLSKPWRAPSENETDPRAKRNDAFCRGQLLGVDGLIPALSHLLDASAVWPVSVVEKVYAPGSGGIRYRLAKLVPVPHHLLDFRQGRLWIKEVTTEGVPTGAVLPCDPVRYIVHRGHLLQSLPDCWGGPGRALVFWWFIGVSARTWWTQGAERSGVPFMVGKYESGNVGDRSALLSAFRSAARMFGLAISKDTEVQVHKDMASGDAGVHQRLLEFAQGQMSRLVVGQTMTTKATAGGLGGAQADVQDDVLTDIVQFDGVLLGATLNEQLLKPLLELNSFDGPVPALSWQVTTEDAQGAAQVVKTLADAGIRIKSEALPALAGSVGFPVDFAGAPAPDAPGGSSDAVPVPALPPAAPSTAPAALALNGAQIKALADLVSAVATGALPFASAIMTAKAGFPDLDDSTLRGIFEPARAFTPAPIPLAAPTLLPPPLENPASAALALAFRGTLAPVRQLIRLSTGAEDLTAKLAEFYPDLSAGRLAALTEEALTAAAASGAAQFRA